MPRFTGSRCGQNVSSTVLPVVLLQHRLDLADVAVRAAGRVGREVLADLAEQQVLAQRAARAGGAALGVGHDVGRLDQPLAQQRHERQQHRGRVAARVRDEPRAREAVAVDLASGRTRPGRAAAARGARGRTTACRPRPSAAAGRPRGRSRAPAAAPRASVPRSVAAIPCGNASMYASAACSRPLSCARWPASLPVVKATRGARVPLQQAHQLPPRVAGRPEDAHAHAQALRLPKRKPAGNRPAGATSPFGFGLGLVQGRHPRGARASPDAGPGSHGGHLQTWTDTHHRATHRGCQDRSRAPNGPWLTRPVTLGWKVQVTP